MGWILLFIRLGLFKWFRSGPSALVLALFSCPRPGIRSLRASGGIKLQNFLSTFEILGSAYFLAFPAIFLLVQLLAAYLQHPVLQTTLLAVQTASWLWLADLFLSKRGNYFEARALERLGEKLTWPVRSRSLALLCCRERLGRGGDGSSESVPGSLVLYS